MSRPRRNSLAFTLLELIVVVVVLGVLAAIAVPTFAAVITRSHDSSAEASLSAYAREVQALSAFDGEGALAPEDFDAAATDSTLAAAPGVFAALRVKALPAPLNAARFEAEQMAVFSYALAPDHLSAALAAVSASGNCVGVHMTLTSTRVVDISDAPSTCNGQSVLDSASPTAGGVSLTDGIAADPATLDQLGTPTLTRSATTTGALLSWDPVANATGYVLRLSDSESMSGAVEVYTGAERSFTVSLEPGVTRYATVTATQGSLTSPPSNVVSVLALPAAPTGVSAVVSGTTATVSWTAVPGAAGYYVYQDGSDTIAATAVGGTTSSVSITLAEGQTASFVVRAYNAAGAGPASASTSGTAAPAAVTNLAAALSGYTATVSWSASSGATGYDVYQDDAVTPVSVAAPSTSASFTLVDGQTSSFKVTARNAGGTSASAGPVSVTVKPAVPTGVSASVSGTTVTVKWTASSGAASYRVFKGGVFVKDVTPGTASSTTVSLAEGESASFTVSAVNAGGESAHSAASNTVTAIPPAPASVSASLSGSTATVTWTASAGASSYTVFRTDSNLSTGATSSKVLGVYTTLSMTDTVPDGYRVVYSVAASSEGGQSFATASNAVQVTWVTNTAGAAGTNMLANGGFESGSTGWSIHNPGGTVNFVVYDKTTSNVSPFEGTKLAATNSNVSSGSIFKDVAVTTVVGAKYCVSAQLTTQNGETGASGTLVLWNGGGVDRAEAGFHRVGTVPNWLRASSCFTATGSTSYLRAELYPASNGKTVFVDDVRVWRAS